MLGFSPLASAPLGDDGVVAAGAAILASASTSAACDFNASVERIVQGSAVSASALTTTATANVLSSILASASTSAALATSASAVSFTAASASASLATSIAASALATKSGRASSALALTGRVRGGSAVNVSASVTAHAAVVAFARYKWQDAARPVDVWTDAPAAGGDWTVKAKTDKNWSDAA